MLVAQFVWISKTTALAIHEYQLAQHGGLAGLRDEGLLDSAVARPQHIVAFSGAAPDVAKLATAYAFAIAKNHPFIDGNKRTAAVVLETIIELNGFSLPPDDNQMYDAIIALVDGTWSEQEFADWLRQNIVPT